MNSIIILLTFFNVVAFWASLLAIRFWLGVYDRAKHGSLAWLLFGIASIYMLSIPLFPHIIFHFTSLDLETKYRISANYMIFWSTIYTLFFAAAGYVLYKSLITCSREELSKLLIEGLAIEEDKRSKVDLGVEERYFISDIIKGKNLIRYSTENCHENAVIELVLRLWGELRNVVIISSYPKSMVYEERLKDLLNIGAIKLVELKATEDCVNANGNKISSSIYNLAALREALARLPFRCVLIIEVTKLELLKIFGIEKLLELPYDTIAFINMQIENGSLKYYNFDREGEVLNEGIKLGDNIIKFRVGSKFYI